ncbi:MAG: LL-diaminopimelate aminotransferase [Nitrospirae bacterium]|nr:LL-diaminopimelate aminotransferase [Candidatus Troglogloeales bacterium]
MTITPANRIKDLPPYLFAAIDKMKQEAIARGKDVINLGIGDPDLPTPTPIIERLQAASADPGNHQYPSYDGMPSFRRAVAKWVQDRFNVTLNPDNEVATLIGSKEGIGHTPLAFINPRDVALMTSPGYPVYHAGTLFAGGISYFVPLLEKNKFLPDLGSIPIEIAKAAKIFFINYPNNPTGAVANVAFFESVVAFARRYNILICHDAAYSELYYDGGTTPARGTTPASVRPASFLEVPGATEVGIEFHSLSKTFNMTGWRIGFVVGNKDAVAALLKVKSNLDSGVFQAVQEAGIAALELPESQLEAIRKIYQERKDLFIGGLNRLGLRVASAEAGFYVWINTPPNVTSTAFAARFLSEADIVVTPGNGFGEAGEGYIRVALTCAEERLVEALRRMEKAKIFG